MLWVELGLAECKATYYCSNPGYLHLIFIMIYIKRISLLKTEVLVNVADSVALVKGKENYLVFLIKVFWVISCEGYSTENSLHSSL